MKRNQNLRGILVEILPTYNIQGMINNIIVNIIVTI